MKQELWAVNYYRHALFDGEASGFARSGAMTYRLGSGFGTYLSPLYDAGGPAGTYHRLRLDGDFSGARLEVLVASADRLDGELFGRMERDPASVPHEKKVGALTALPHVRTVGSTDILLHALTGRYLWIYITVQPAGDSGAELAGMRLELPRHSFTRYFPEIYQDNDLFERYIAIFQTLYLEQERRVDLIPRRLDYETTEDENVEYLAGWLGIKNDAGLYTPAQLRHMIRELDLFQGRKGTAYALPKVLGLITGMTPHIVEYHRWDSLGLSPEMREHCGRLYGPACDDYAVIFDLTKHPGPLPVPEDALERIVEDYSVTGARFRIVYLRPECRDDTHCYLDVNSVLASPEIARLDESAYDAQTTAG